MSANDDLAVVRPSESSSQNKNQNSADVEARASQEEDGCVYANEEQEQDEDEDLEWIPADELQGGQERPGDGEPQVVHDEEEVVVCPPCEPAKVKLRPAPHMPTAAERAEHEVTHCPYRSWCDVCVRALGREDPHNRVSDKEESALPTVGMDYDKYGEEEAVGNQVTSLILKDSETGMIKGHVVEVNGPRDEWVLKRCCKDIEGLGHAAMMFLKILVL